MSKLIKGPEEFFAGVARAWKDASKGSAEPLEDYGFFGPDSVTWRVWSYPTSVTVGFQRSVVVEELDPHLIAAVDATGDIYSRPRTRYDRTLRYFATVMLGDSRSVSRAADVLVKVHSKAVGTDPLKGDQYDANNPESQLWIHMTAWHSILYTYEKFGPGRLSDEEERQYWAECAIAAEFQTIDPETVPRSREEVREYFEMMRPKLAGTEAAQRAMDHLLTADVTFPPVPAYLRPGAAVISRALRHATIATMPGWMRKMGGLQQPKAVDVAITPVMKLSFRVVDSNPRFLLMLLGLISPSTVPIAAPALHGVEPANPEVLTPAQARERYGYSKPADAHREWREKQNELMRRGERTSDEGLVESQELLGSLTA